MKFRKFFGKWLLVILVMAIGIGTYAALSLNDRNRDAGDASDAGAATETAEEEESSQAKPESYLTNQRKHDIDMDILSGLMGEYQSTGEGGIEEFWHLSIMDEYEGKGPYLSVYDNSAGNPGFEGRIMYLQKGLVIVEIDQDLYDGMPADWKLEGEDKYAILDIEKSGDSVRLGYRGSDGMFAPAE